MKLGTAHSLPDALCYGSYRPPPPFPLLLLQHIVELATM
jgi:hypothetical protein